MTLRLLSMVTEHDGNSQLKVSRHCRARLRIKPPSPGPGLNLLLEDNSPGPWIRATSRILSSPLIKPVHS